MGTHARTDSPVTGDQSLEADVPVQIQGYRLTDVDGSVVREILASRVVCCFASIAEPVAPQTCL